MLEAARMPLVRLDHRLCRHHDPTRDQGAGAAWKCRTTSCYAS